MELIVQHVEPRRQSRHDIGEVLGLLDVNALAVFPVKLVELEGLGVPLGHVVVVAHQLVAAYADGALQCHAVGEVPDHGVTRRAVRLLDQTWISGILE